MLTVGVSSVVAPLLSAGAAIVGFGASRSNRSGRASARVTTACLGHGRRALLANPITWIVAAVIAAVALLYIYWKPITAFFIRLWAVVKDAFSGAWQACVNAWRSAVDWFSGIWSGIRNAFLGAWNGVVGFLSGIWGTIQTAFDGGIMGVLGLFVKFSPLGMIVRALDAVTSWLFGFSLIDAGSNILNTLTAGIVAAASGPIDAIKNVVQRIRNHLPFSPAKEGPLRDLHRVKLVETIASAVHPEPLVRAMRGADCVGHGSRYGWCGHACRISPTGQHTEQCDCGPVHRSQIRRTPSEMSVTFQFGEGSASAVRATRNRGFEIRLTRGRWQLRFKVIKSAKLVRS